MSAAWREAEVDLGIRVEAPYVHVWPEGDSVEYVALIPDFGSPKGMAVRRYGTSSGSHSLLPDVVHRISTVNYEAFGQYDRHRWIDYLEDQRWFGPAHPPLWYTAISPWHHDRATREVVTDELRRIFGRPMSLESSAPYRVLDLLPGDEVLAFLHRVPTNGVTADSFTRWTMDIAEEWSERHPRPRSGER